MIPTYEINQVVSAIYRTEGGTHTRYPYGIRSIRTTTPRECCFRTVRNEAIRLHVSHVDRYFIYCLADRYCPPSCDKQGNLNWKHNMIAILHL